MEILERIQEASNREKKRLWITSKNINFMEFSKKKLQVSIRSFWQSTV